MARRTSLIRRSTLAQVLISMAPVASAALSLASFQSITDIHVPLGCILAYDNGPLSGCSHADFTAGRGCSLSCTRSLGLVQANLQSVCAGVETAPASVLGAALRGSLVEVLCGRALDEASTSTSDVIPSSMSQQPTQTPPTTPTSQQPSSSAPVSRGSVAQTGLATQRGVESTGTPSPQEALRGGGSPFDGATASASHIAASRTGSTLFWAMAVGLFGQWSDFYPALLLG